jgi:uncharacterized protein (DUF4415 family)
MKRRWILPTEKEERQIAEGIASDADAAPDISTLPRGAYRVVGRPKSARPKEALNIRLDADVLDHFRRTGPGWQTRINAVLRKAAGL